MDSLKQMPKVSRCDKYNEICSKEKMCGDCSADEYDKEQYYQSLEEYKLDRTFALLNLFPEKVSQNRTFEKVPQNH